MSLIPVTDFMRGGEAGGVDAGLQYCRLLEEGHILLFPQTPFDLPENERAFLLTQQQVDAGYQKNIAYRPNEDEVTGFIKHSDEDVEKLRRIMRAYSQRVTRFLARLLLPYASAWRLDYASFRPQEEKGRDLLLLARNDLLHVDAFPTRPTHGDRILRVFTNINPVEVRRWITSDTADVLIERFAGSPGLPLPKSLGKSTWQQMRRFIAKMACSVGLPVVPRSPYDEFMLRLHNYLKENGEFQSTCAKQELAFPPGSTWSVFTDLVSHAALSGQYALEQTFIIARKSLVLPEKAPVSILEKMVGGPLTE
jgi:3-deoxy-D-manno-octulosonic acid hydroxylase-like protein